MLNGHVKNSPTEANNTLNVSMQLNKNLSNKKHETFNSIVDTRDRKGFLPLFFERASGNLFNPCFDSEILESEFQRLCVTIDKRCFQIALLYMSVVSVILSVYIATSHNDDKSHIKLAVGCAVACVIAIIVFFFTRFNKFYSRIYIARSLSVILTLVYCGAEVAAFFVVNDTDFSYSARFGLATCMITVIYTMMPALPLYGIFILALAYSVARELAASFRSTTKRTGYELGGIIILHLCIHALGLTAVFMAQVRKRSTFWRVGQSVVAKQDLDIEQRVKNRMIKSVMPKKVADFLIENGLKHKRVKSFRPFSMYKMENVSILFADIVGFTNMSANKEADDLVHLLNLLFGKFDELTEINNCEKISTLGDCYYCVAGCPEESEYHAISCIEMGLDIVEEIKNFRKKTGEEVDMRVGIHTGNILCGVVGNRRRRFDVWSNDVNLANKMESKGKPGMVHITEVTRRYFKDQYVLLDGDGIEYSGGKLSSYFISCRKNGISAYKPWQKTSDFNKRNGSVSNIIDHLDVESKSINCQVATSKSSLSINKVDVSFSIHNHITPQSDSDDSIENEFLSKSISTLSSPSHFQENLPKKNTNFSKSSATFNFSYGLALNEALMRDAMKASNDNQLVKLMHGKKIQREYFFNPPLHWWSLTFIDEVKVDKKENDENEDDVNISQKTKIVKNITEAKYRDEGFKGLKLNPKVTTFASPKVHFLFDVVTSAIILIGVIIVCILFYKNFPTTLAILIGCSVLIMLSLLVLKCYKLSPSKFQGKMSTCAANPENSSTDDITSNNMESITTESLHDLTENSNLHQSFKSKLFSAWVTSHLYGGIIMCLPIIVVFSTYEDCKTNNWKKPQIEYFAMLMFVSLLHFCNFTQLSSLMKTSFAYIWALAFILMLVVLPSSNCMLRSDKSDKVMIMDIVLVVILQIILITILNRIHEQGVRANFYGDKEAAEQKNIALEQKQVADWLINDMFPRYVSEELKFTNNCSKNYEMVGVLFATIVNFSGFYEENFAGGLECIRILHELVADFDNELVKFQDIEKIKTVYGTTFMAASGLNQTSKVVQLSDEKDKQYLHLKSLMDFALVMQRSLDDFNENMLGFKFHLRCGFNAGPVTAGVIGTMKPQYDIWGDTVNVASRMDSTGVVDKIQVSEECMKKLENFYTFTERGAIPVKGKGMVTAYLLVSKK
ncbi:adenylate cyclase type 9 [Hydra vulgaris]|uniref:Adenylate cyclase type 9 n=1 Tax=Hydra vulgaris TaxID=6087 RepID=T2MHX8_HYDVU|nr:adenylate cyclase type 9-like [Hydra vulgaris]XP_047126449.1 adenylate cyclase type 9-like [Hydra vulgaris]